MYESIVQNLRTYLLKVCQDLKVYQSVWREQELWPHNPSYMLFKVVNNCSYLLATRSTFNKLFKSFDISELFSVLFRFVAEELSAWYHYYSAQLTAMIAHTKQGEKDELDSLHQLVHEANRLHSKASVYCRMSDIYNIPLDRDSLKPVRVPVEFRLSVEKLSRSTSSLVTGKRERMRKVMKMESQERTFAEDELQERHREGRSSRKHSLNKSMMVYRPFRCD